ncbi:DUF5707 domain-containing protein [Streptomyces chryseus]|uniref:Calcium-binding protein n=1 Tax=Streptomyces chryseus TaxID=68186 RepID=A0ABQ3DVA4_9ACTN|nr:DUF5707 domain-containing protein [Streptomyces chryseus]GGX31528.1 hypothetical protein GCM10010353_53220 [Streptomyces chryseus]GHB14672.1 hypothetical protein GCM10010346_42910 [Streptomyces chryseus]
MRIRATVAAVSGALALSAFAVPAAQAEDAPKAGALSAFAGQAPADDVVGDTQITNVVVNGGKDIVLGTTNPKTITVSVTATDPSGIQDAYVALWHGASADDVDGYVVPNEEAATCTESSATTATCKLTITIDPQLDLYMNSLAGTWKVEAAAQGKDEDFVWKDAYKTHRVQRFSKLTVDASPEPVVKGKTITVTGKLSRANWETSTYAGYTAQPVKLQFRKAGTSTYTTVKTVTSSSTGTLKATVTAASDGYFRYSFAGTSTTPAVSAAGDYVDVR